MPGALNPAPFGLFGYGTAALTYGLFLLTGFPRARSEEERKKIRASLICNGWTFGGIAQFLTGLLFFLLFTEPAYLIDATTFCIFGMLWTSIWLNDYFNLDPRALLYLDLAIAYWTIFAGIWNAMLNHYVIAVLLWSITILVVVLAFHRVTGKAARFAGFWAFENAVLAYYLSVAIIFNSVFGMTLPL